MSCKKSDLFIGKELRKKLADNKQEKNMEKVTPIETYTACCCITTKLKSEDTRQLLEYHRTKFHQKAVW
jgi:hypothetical protein